jgi:hypothetical protein
MAQTEPPKDPNAAAPPAPPKLVDNNWDGITLWAIPRFRRPDWLGQVRLCPAG